MIRLLELRNEKNLSQRQMAKEMNVSQGTYNNWENGKTQPSIEQLISLARFFSVSVDFLIGNSDEFGATLTTQSLSPEQQALLNKFYSLSKPAKKALIEFLNNL